MKIKSLVMLGALSLLFSCQNEEPIADQKETLEQELEITPEILSQIEALSLNPEDVETITTTFPDGSTRTSLLIEGDIAISAAELESMRPVDISNKQYRTYNLVTSPRVIEVIGYTGLGFNQNLTALQQDALTEAVANYNDLNLGLSFNLTFTNDLTNADIIVFQNPNGAAGGVAGFPSAGNPYLYVQIYSGMENYSLEVNTHVMTHEIGHTLGLRHTDWFTRQSCGRPSFGELANPSGAVHIPGTPYRLDPNSVMLSCFGLDETGEFGRYDIVALEYLY